VTCAALLWEPHGRSLGRHRIAVANAARNWTHSGVRISGAPQINVRRRRQFAHLVFGVVEGVLGEIVAKVSVPAVIWATVTMT
jgi:hypothetical protein